ncbi:MAG: Na+ efflux pump ABC transporter [Planctomycetota bacterium]|nr:MAG: Na+ efflux pump ABC transporter [Planctomycetota bacterium]
MIRLPNVLTIFRKEMIDLLRDRRTIFGMVVVPILIYPLLLIMFSQVLASQTERLMTRKYSLVVVGALNAPGLVEHLKTDDSWEITEAAPGSDAASSDTPLLEGAAHVVLVVPAGFLETMQAEKSATVELRFNKAKDESNFALHRAREAVEDYSAQVLRIRLQGKPDGFERPVVADENDIAPPERTSGFHLGRLLAMLLVLMSAVSAFYPAIDMASGEKERGTMETLLVSPALRSEIVFGKYLAVATIAAFTAVLHLTSMGVTFSYFFKNTLGAAKGAGLTFSIRPSSALLVLLPLIPLNLLFSALCLGLSAFARSYKEAMVYLTPVMIVANVASFSALVPGIEFNYALALIPIQNCAMLTVALLSGDWKWGHVLATFASSSVYALVALRWTWSIFQREDVLLRGGADFDWKRWLKTWGSARPGLGTALVAVIAMMALTLTVGPTLQGMKAHRLMLAHQLLIIALPAGIIAMLASLNFRSTFRIRAANPVHLALAPVIAVCALVLLTTLAAWLVDFAFFKKSALEHGEKLIETQKALGGLPTILVFMALLPAVCEEFLFRGIVLSGLRRDLGRWAGIAACGAFFGVAHQVPLVVLIVSLFGMILGWMALHSGSLLVSVVTHAIWNASLLIAQAGKVPRWLLPDKGFPAWPVVTVAALVLPAAIWAFHRARGSDEEELAGDGGATSIS